MVGGHNTGLSERDPHTKVRITGRRWKIRRCCNVTCRTIWQRDVNAARNILHLLMWERSWWRSIRLINYRRWKQGRRYDPLPAYSQEWRPTIFKESLVQGVFPPYGSVYPEGDVNRD